MMKLLIPFFLLVSALFCQDTFNPSVAIQSCDYLFVAPTGSMRPTITEDNVIVYKKLPFKEIRVGPYGDIIIYKLKSPVQVGGIISETVCHRAVRKSSGGSIIITRGDNNDRDDSILITEENYVGTVVAIMRREKLDNDEAGK